MTTILYITIGLLSGIISGMGIGGGTILIPALSIFFNMNQHTVQNINLIYFIPTAITALVIHIKNKQIEKKILFKITAFGLLGAVLGAILAVSMNPNLLKKLFGGFLVIMGTIEFKKEAK